MSRVHWLLTTSTAPNLLVTTMALMHCCNHQLSSLPSSSIPSTVARKLMFKWRQITVSPLRSPQWLFNSLGVKPKVLKMATKPLLLFLISLFIPLTHSTQAVLAFLQFLHHARALHWLFALPRKLSLPLVSVLVTPPSPSIRCSHSQWEQFLPLISIAVCCPLLCLPLTWSVFFFFFFPL